jgi:chromate reductase, NAD(P)H dehydrogenase (quinone)
MSRELRILVTAGSARQGAFSVKLATAAAAALRTQGATATLLDLRTLALPVYDADLEASQGVPEGARTLRDAIVAHDALLVVTPEYNGFPTPLFINAFDWLSRVPAAGDAPSGLGATASRPAALLSSSPGPLGGLRAMNYVRQYLSMNFAMLVAPQQFALSRANEAFDEAGALKDARAQQSVNGVLQALLRVAGALA